MSLAGKTIALTGAMSQKRSYYEDLITRNGGTIAASVTKKVTHLVAANPNEKTGKMDKAREQGIVIVGEDWLTNIDNGGAPAEVAEVAPAPKKIVTKKAKTESAPAPNAPKQTLLTKNGTAELPKLSGMVIALTGRLSKTKEEYGAIVAAHGGTLAGTVTKKTTHVVARDSDSASDKLEKAKKYGATVVGEDFLLELGDATVKVAPSKPKKCVSKQVPEDGEELPDVVKMASPPLVLLAKEYDAEKHGSHVGYWCSEKLDGVRAWWDGEQFWSRTGNLFYAPSWFREQMPKNCILDGELFIGRKQFKQTVSIVKSHSMSRRWEELTYMVFDIPSEKNKPYEERLAIITEMCKTERKNMRLVESHKLTEKDDIVKMLKDVEELGGEGLMLRKAGSLYIGKRSDTLLKIKTFFDDEAKVLGYVSEGKGRLAGMTGSLHVIDRHGIEFDVGSGMDDETRMHPPEIGSIITFRYQEKSADSGRPRFPVYVGIAIDKDFP